MKVLVPIKRVVDYNVRVRVKADGSGVDLSNTKMSMNPFDELALEEAVRLKEKGIATEVVVVSIGPRQAQETLRAGIALGADHAILVETEESQGDMEPLAVAKILAKVVGEQQPSLVIMGKQAIDNDMGATGQMLAGLLGWGQATFACAVAVDGAVVRVDREVDGGVQVIELPLPAVITVDLRLNEPRYASLPNIMKAKKKAIEERSASELGVDLSPRLAVLTTVEPPGRPAGRIVGTVDELLAGLRERGVL
ncbi:electron transfer flavoprotein subunit beta/FixA family protein [Devosia sp. SL43]|uniref:electron transfer flavoprotein subunit beta/FixA family protein n=1 Tax=Devosia sp. SL43 TaxID=2806348 RepID=UPI001F417EF2|nr:electron transfer flavoprotein subunit beta/FixA family protein [Devosia sp. SL43]UJW86545.1 electron transfer flavoprotein subunit beta/FixA family protein [Devosia sp. SL43]